jgi:hypothetical protein
LRMTRSAASRRVTGAPSPSTRKTEARARSTRAGCSRAGSRGLVLEEVNRRAGRFGNPSGERRVGLVLAFFPTDHVATRCTDLPSQGLLRQPRLSARPLHPLGYRQADYCFGRHERRTVAHVTSRVKENVSRFFDSGRYSLMSRDGTRATAAPTARANCDRAREPDARRIRSQAWYQPRTSKRLGARQKRARP